MPQLPNPLSVTAAVGSQWPQGYQLFNDDGTLMNIATKTFEFVVRSDPAQAGTVTPLIVVKSTGATAAGYITVTTATSSLLVVLSATATAALSQQQYYYTLWMDPGLPDATALVSGTFYADYVAAA